MGSEHPFPHKNLNFQWNIYRVAIGVERASQTHPAEYSNQLHIYQKKSH
jgi:hypothetical protein